MAGAYRPDRGRVQTVRTLAVILLLVAAFGGAPAVLHPDLETAPGWSRLVLFVALLEIVYIAWMAITPDWSTVWVLMLLLAAVTAGYAAATAIAVATPLDAPLPLGMSGVRGSAARWCGSVLMVHGLATYLCGRTSTKWRRALELESAARRRPGEVL